MKRYTTWSAILLLICTTALWSQQSADSTAIAQIPHLVKFSGTLKDVNGNPASGTVGVTFALYSEQSGGVPLWLEMQNVQPDKNGHYTVLLGSTKPDGLAVDLFTSGQAQWLGVQPEGQSEQPRALLVSVPYALKAGDAETIGGLPPSAFQLANSSTGAGSTKSETAQAATPNLKNPQPAANAAVTGKGVIDYIPMWDTTSDIVDSIIFQKSSEIGINTTTPAATLDVNGKTDIRDTLTLYPKSTDNTLAVNGTNFKIDSTGKVTFITGQTFPGTGTITGITTASGSGLSGGGTTGTLSLKVPSAGITNAMLASSKITLNASTAGGLTVPGAMTLGDTYTIGLKTCSSGQILQYNGTAWGCATVSGTGTITGVTAGTDLTGGGTSGTVTLKLDTTKVPQLAAANTFTGNQLVNGNLTSTGTVSGGSFQIGSTLFAYGSWEYMNAFLGFSGNAGTSGTGNTANGQFALGGNTYGSGNTADGLYALESNTTGNSNTADGYEALLSNTIGNYNTADGVGALINNAAGSYNTAVGYMAGPDSSQPNLINATAIGAQADVTQSNSLVLGAVAGQNGAGYNTWVGIGTTAPVAALDVQSGSVHVGTIGPTTVQGAYLGWNMSAGQGETDFVNNEGLGYGGWWFVNTNSSGGYNGWSAYLDSSGNLHSSSSRRWKTNINTLHGALGKVGQLRGVSYDRKGSGKHEIGVIAEEVGAVVPEVVSWDRNGTDALGVDYARLTALLIEATKEQQTLIREQQAQIARLTRQVKTIQATLKANEQSNSEPRTVKAEGKSSRR